MFPSIDCRPEMPAAMWSRWCFGLHYIGKTYFNKIRILLMNSKFPLTPEEIKRARESLGLSRADVALELGFAVGNTASISMWERGEREVPFKHHAKLLHILKNGIPESNRSSSRSSSKFTKTRRTTAKALDKNINYSKNEKVALQVKDHEQIGEGNHCVYLYYLPIHKENAELKGEGKWRCKIGRSKYPDPSIRTNQQKIGLPEQPEHGLTILTNKPEELEDAIHDILKGFGRYIPDAPGKEWFFTSPNEIKWLYNFLIKDYK